jgi:phage shock protein C
MYCTRCGTQLDEGARFCVSCGKPTGEEVPVAAATPPGASTFAETKRLRRILQGKKIAGVCAGYAEYFAMDVTLMRLIWIGLLLIPPHIGLFGYVVSWIVLPKE